MVLPSEPRDPGRPGPSGLTCGASLPARAGAPSTLRPVACRPASGARSGPLSEVWRCQVIAPGGASGACLRWRQAGDRDGPARDSRCPAPRSARCTGCDDSPQPVERELRVELLARDAELPGRTHLVAARQDERSLDQGSLRLLEREQRSRRSDGCSPGLRRGERELREADPPLARREGVLDDVEELANVAEPGLREEELHRFGGHAPRARVRVAVAPVQATDMIFDQCRDVLPSLT